MQAQELHIELDILLQKVNSHYNQNFIPQEKDLFINNEVLRYIKRRIDKLSNRKQTGIFDTIKRTTDLSPLLVTRRLPVMYNENNQKEAKVMLPFDFLYYVSSEVSVCCPCMGNKLYTNYLQSYQLFASETSTINGTLSFTAVSIFSFIICLICSVSEISASIIISSCTCKTIFDFKFLFSNSLYTFIIAIFIMSAAVPCIGVFIATLFPN